MDSYILFQEHSYKDEFFINEYKQSLIDSLHNRMQEPVANSNQGNYWKTQNPFDYYSVNQVYRYTIRTLIESIRSFS